MPQIPISRFEKFIDELEAALAPRRVMVVGENPAECRELLIEKRARGEVGDDDEIVFICTGVPRHHREDEAAN